MEVDAEGKLESCNYYSARYGPSQSEHDYSSIHDMIDMDVNSNMESLYPQVSESIEKADNENCSSTTKDVFSQPPSAHHHGSPSSSANVDLDSSVSNLSWLQNLQQQIPETNGNPNLLVDPQTVAPVVTTASPGIRIVTLASNGHYSSSNSLKYMTVPHSKHMYIPSAKSIMSTQPHTYKPSLMCQQSYNHGLSSAPSSTTSENPYKKPPYSYSCLIALSLKNSRAGSLPVAEIYNFMMTNFPYFKTAPDGWKVRLQLLYWYLVRRLENSCINLTFLSPTLMFHCGWNRFVSGNQDWLRIQ